MYLHECYVVPKAALIAVVEYLRKRPYEDVNGLLAGLDGSPEGTAKELAKAGVAVVENDQMPMLELVRPGVFNGTLPTPGETVVDFPAGVGRQE